MNTEIKLSDNTIEMLLNGTHSEPELHSERYAWCKEMINGTQILIAGCSGSGKSVAIHDLIYTLLEDSPEKNMFVLIDLKKVELIDYIDAPHTVAYVDEPKDVTRTLELTCKIMDQRYKRMQEQRIKKTSDPTLWVIIDEYSDIVHNCPKVAQRLVERIAYLGRAAGIRIIMGTQRPCREIVSGIISCNLDTKLALRTVTAQDSRNIIQVNGCESLPDYGYGIMQIKGRNRKIEIPMTSDFDIRERVRFWQIKEREVQ